MNLEILYEDNHILIVNKPAGVLSQGDKTGDASILDYAKKYIKKKYKKQGNVFLQLPHRLDRPTSGILILSKTSKATERLNKMFANGEIHKTYWAVVDKAPPKDSETIEHYLLKDPKTNKSKAFDNPVKNAKKASLTYKLIGASRTYYLLEIQLHTGRHHQIRAQLAKIGLHIKGDLKYGAKRSNQEGGIHLHARTVEFMHPVKKEPISVTAQPPHDQIWDNFFNLW